MQEKYSGPGSINRLPEVLSARKAGSILLVCRERSFALSGAAEFFRENIEGKVRVHRFSGFSENPKAEEIDSGLSVLKDAAPDIIVAVGGGSAIDTAKLINFFSTRGTTGARYISGDTGAEGKCRPLAAVPTTMGSGSEATRFAVMYSDRKKYSVEHESIKPEVVILDPVLTLSLPPGVIAASSMDALSQAVESYWSVNSGPESKGYAEAAIKALLRNMTDAFNRKTPSAAEAVMEAAYLSGKAIDLTKTTAPHAISYTLTSNFGVSHGQAVGLLLPSFFEYNHNVEAGDCADKRGPDYVKKTVLELCRMFGCEDPASAKSKVRELMSGIALHTRLSQAGIRDRAQIDLIVENVNAERLANNPRAIGKAQVRELLAEML